MILRLILSILLISFSAKSALAAIDPEVAESLRCMRLFPYFEKKHRIPLDTLHSISLKESGKPHSQHKIKIVWPWAVNVEGQGYYFDTKREAISFVRKQLFMGKESIDIGCMQINLKHHPKVFSSLEHAFDPRKNIAYGAEFLKSKYEQLKCWHKAIAHYHSATHDLGFKYKQDVIKIAGNMYNYKDSLKKYARPHPSSINRYASQEPPNMKSHRRFNRSTDFYRSVASIDEKSTSSQRKSSRLSANRIRSNMMVPVH